MGLDTRLDQLELMDTIQLPPATMRRTLSFLALTNRRFGGSQIVLDILDSWSARWPDREIKILDIGTGAGDIPIAIAKWARAKKLRVKIIGIDLVPEVIQIAREQTRNHPEISIEEADLFSFNQRADYVIASLFLHHVPPAQNKDALIALDRLAERGLIVSDLQRTQGSLVAVSALSYLAGNHIVRHDGPLSVRRAFRPHELDALALEAGLSYLRARNERWFRLSLSGEKNV